MKRFVLSFIVGFVLTFAWIAYSEAKTFVVRPVSPSGRTDYSKPAVRVTVTGDRVVVRPISPSGRVKYSVK